MKVLLVLLLMTIEGHGTHNKSRLCASNFSHHSCGPVSECSEQTEDPELVFCSNGSIVNNCSNGGIGGCCRDTSTFLLSFCKSTSQFHNHSTMMMTFLTTLSQSITSFSTESTANFLSNNFTTEAATVTFLSNNLTTKVTAIQTTTQSTQDTTHINNLTIITISLGGILLLIVLTLAVICVMLSVVIIAKRHHQFQPGDDEPMENIYTISNYSYMYTPATVLPEQDQAVVNDTTYSDIANDTSAVLRSTDNPMYASVNQLNIVPKSNVTTSTTEELPIDSVPTSPNGLDYTTGDIYSAVVRENGEKVTVHIQRPLVATEEDT